MYISPSTQPINPSTTIVNYATIFGDGIPIWWQSSDLSLYSPATPSGPTTTAQSITSATARTSTSIGHNGISNKGKLGIEIGVPVAVTAIVIGLLACWSYIRRRKRHRLEQELEDRSIMSMPKPPVPVAELPKTRAVFEIFSDHDQYNRHHELPGSPGSPSS